MLKRGNIVKFKCGFHGDKNDPVTGKLGIIQFSYGERYGNGKIYGGYSVLYKETGISSAWWDEDKLEFVSEGSEDEITKCEEIYIATQKKYTDLNYIKEEIIKGNLKLSSTSILTLFHEIGYDSAFNRNGEYYILFDEWSYIYPIFVAVFNKEYDKTIKILDYVFTEENKEKCKEKIIEFYNKLNG